jgi:hypothetical protein
MNDNSAERRHFSRILFDAWAELRQGEQVWHTAVVDLSLKGLLVREPADWQIDAGQPLRAAIRLEETAVIYMTVRIRHAGKGLLGFSCEQIDMESAGNLRRLVELNLGDAELLERQLGALGGQQ